MAGFVPVLVWRNPGGKPDADRRSARRYAVQIELEYRLFRYRSHVETGHGHTINFSTTGILFASERELPPRYRIDLAIEWPARIDEHVPLTMWVQGQIVRSAGTETAVRIKRYGFRTRGRAG